MTPERFADLAEAYGGDLSRWPAEERDAASALQAREPACAALLARAAALDSALTHAPAASPSAALVGRVIAASSAAGGRMLLVWRWLTGAALAGACAAGVLVGAFAAPVEWSGLTARSDEADEASALIIDTDTPGDVR